MRTRRVGVLTALCLVLSLFVADITGAAPPAAAAGGGVIDLTGSVPATFTVTPGVEQMTITGATPRAPLTIAHAGSLERIITLYTDDLGQLVVQYVPEDFLVFDPQTQGVLPTVDGTTLRTRALKGIDVEKITPDEAAAHFRALHFVLGALGITLPEAAPAEEAPPEIQALAQRRWEAKQAKDWPAADALRDEIKAAGWIVKDAKDGFELERE